MRITSLSSILLIIPSIINAQDLEMLVGYQNQNGTIKDSSNEIDLDMTGYTIAGRLDISEQLGLDFGYGSGEASVNIGGTATDLDMTSSMIGVSYLIYNSLDGIKGRGNKSSVSLLLTDTELSAGSISQKGSSEYLSYSAEFPVMPRLTTLFSASTRLNSGSNYDADLGVSYYYWSNKNSINLEYGVDRSDEDGVQTNGNTLYVTFSFKN